MTAFTVQCATVGALWQKALALWDAYATGVYTAWSWAYTSGQPYRVWTITVTNPDTSTDTYALVGLDCEPSARPPLTYIAAAPGWRSPPPRAYPTLLPDGSNAKSAYGSMLWPLRKDIHAKYGGSTIQGEDEAQTSGSYGVDTHVWFGLYLRSDGMVVLDATGISWGTLAADTTYAYPSDFVGASTPQALIIGGSGGSVDLTPLVTAVNEIANKDTTISINDGDTVIETWSAVETSS